VFPFNHRGCNVRGSPEARRVSTRKLERALTLHDRLSQLTFDHACKLLGPRGAALIRHGGQIEVDDLPRIPVDAERFALTFPVPRRGVATLTFRLTSDRARRRSGRRRTSRHQPGCRAVTTAAARRTSIRSSTPRLVGSWPLLFHGYRGVYDSGPEVACVSCIARQRVNVGARYSRTKRPPPAR
jgi:hypothetical protein